MKGFDVYNRVMTLLGYSDDYNKGNLTGEKSESVTEAINSVLEDLKCDTIKLLSDEIPENTVICQAVVYGTAMLLALIDGETDKCTVFSSIYNAKRCTVLSCIQKVKEKSLSDFRSESHEI